MQNKFSEFIKYIIRELLIVFMSEKLTPLHITSHKFAIEESRRERELLKLSKKMVKIINRFSQTDSKIHRSAKIQNNIELFYEVYNKMDNLTLGQLRILRDFCYALKDDYNLVITKYGEEESEDSIYYKYSSIIDQYIDEKRLRKINMKR